MLRKELLFFAGTALRNIDCREEPAVGELAVQDQLHVTRAFEFLENEFIHAGSRIHQRRGQNGQGTALFDLARRGEHLARNFQGASVDATGHSAATPTMDRVVSACYPSDGIKQDKNVFARFNHASTTLDHES